MKVLITGGAGRLGSEVVRHLAEGASAAGGREAIELRVTDARVRRDLPVKVEAADLRDPIAVYHLLDGCDAVVHLGNYPDLVRGMLPQTVFQENAAMNAHVFQAAADSGVTRIVFASSVQAISGDRRGRHVAPGPDHRPSTLAYLPLDGALPARPGTAYGLSKQAGEAYLQMLGLHDPSLSMTSIRFPFLAGVDRLRAYRERRGREREISAAYWDEIRVDEGFSFLELSDAAKLIAAVLRRQGPGVHTMMPANPANTLGWDIPRIIETCYEGVPLRVEPEEMSALVDTSPITAAVGWVPSPVDLFGEG